MLVKKQIKPIDRLTTSIVYEMKKVNVFHYNKLAYLFEYFYIKNFGERFNNKKSFIRYPHGPVITNYKNQISNLVNCKIISADIDELKRKKSFDDGEFIKIFISSTENTENNIINDAYIFQFLRKIIERYGYLTSDELEKLVYKTRPMKKYLEMEAQGYKKETGSYIFDNCITFKDYKNEITEGRRLAMQHLRKYPKINPSLQNQIAQELVYLEKLRPHF